MDSTKTVCVTLLIIMALWMFQGRYVFINDTQELVSVGDRWTGCVDYFELDTKQVASKVTTNQKDTEPPIPEGFKLLSDEEVGLDPSTARPYTPPLVSYGKMIRSEC